MPRLVIALAGNPNSGKTTLFNILTGARQKVGNWPGVTVEKKTGDYLGDRGAASIVDLPGTYSLSVPQNDGSLDEKVARNYLFGGDVDVVINVIDASNLERNLYLTAQLLELQIPMVLALNKMDVVDRNGTQIDLAELSARLGCPVIPVSAIKKTGVEKLIETAKVLAGRPVNQIPSFYSADVDAIIDEIRQSLTDTGSQLSEGHKRWLAIKILEGDNLQGLGLINSDLEDCLAKKQIFVSSHTNDTDLLVADGRFTFAHQLVSDLVKTDTPKHNKISDFLDHIVLNRFAGPFIFLGLIYLMFMFTINLGGAFIDFFDLAAAALFVDGLGEILTAIGTPDWLRILVADGVGGGFQVVATFVPIIGFLYLFLALLEDSGYMARAAFLMDRLMRKIGLPGKSFVPLIVGFGCNVPAIMATRTLDQQRDRIMTAMMAPFMSCGARLAVYALFAAAFFPTGGQNIVFALYLIGIAAAVATGFFLKKTILQGEALPFVMELPPYNLPRPRDVLINAWVRLKGFLLGAGKIIVIVVAILTVMNSLGKDGSFGNEDSENSILSEVGKWITPILSPLGITEENWPASVGVFTGIFAKEAVVGTLDALYSGLAEQADNPGNADEASPFDIAASLQDAWQTIPDNLAALSDLFLDPLGLAITNVEDGADNVIEELELTDGTLNAMASRFDGRVGAFAYLLFILLYTPCVAALGAINRELGPRWTVFATIWTTGFAFALSIGYYQIARFDRNPTVASFWIGGIIASIVLIFLVMRNIGGKLDKTTHSTGAQSYAFATGIKPAQQNKTKFSGGSGNSSCH